MIPKPDQPETGGILLITDGKTVDVRYDDMAMYVMVHLFYCAMVEIPGSRQAIALAIHRYDNEQAGN